MLRADPPDTPLCADQGRTVGAHGGTEVREHLEGAVRLADESIGTRVEDLAARLESASLRVSETVDVQGQALEGSLTAMGERIAASPHPFRAALLANHGAVVSGEDLARAVDSTIELEEWCRIALLTQGAVRTLIAPEHVRALADRWGMPWTGPLA